VDGTSVPAAEQAWRNLGVELRRLRTERGLSLSELALQVHYSTGYLSKLETGKKRITREVASLVDEALGTGGVLAGLVFTPEGPQPAADELAPADTDVCPYPGLAAFRPQETRWFFGRDDATSELLSQLDDRLAGGGQPLVVVAPSGAGKSSLLAAGLVPALACGRLPGSRIWPVVATSPGGHPLANLAAQVGKQAGTDPPDVTAAIAAQWCATLLTSMVPTCGGKRETFCPARVVLLVDQFEEIFTECRDETERRAFIAALCAAADTSTVLVVLGLRADFYDQCLAYPSLLTTLQAPVALGSMNAHQLRAVITGPAAAEGLDVEPGLVELLLRDLGVNDDSGARSDDYDQGALPLLAHALRAVWQQRSGRVLTVAGYQRTGGIREAIATIAERAYTRLPLAEQEIAQQIFLRLVQVDSQGGAVRRRVPRDRLIRAMLAPVEVTEKVLETFGRARMLTFDTATVEITHEAVLRAWPRLAKWISANRAGLRIHQLLAEAAEVWEAEGRDPFGLYRGSRLTIAQDWASAPGRMAQLSELERTYLKASVDQRRREEQAESCRRTRRMRTVVGALVILLIVVACVCGTLT
jgi:transcriptional regulator with XRE-family HTH domain